MCFKSGGNKEDCVAELLKNDCEYVVVLAVYHQMETRVSLRLLVLQVRNDNVVA